MSATTPTKPKRPGRKANSSSPSAKQKSVRTKLALLEIVILAYEKASLEAGLALRTVRDERLYMPHTIYKTFKDYVVNTYTFGIRQAQYLIAFADRVDSFTAAGLVPPATSAQCRALKRLYDADQIPTWTQLVEEHGSAEAVTAPMIDAFRPAGGDVAGTTVQAYVPPDDQPQEQDDRSQGPDTSMTNWPAEARRALRDVPKPHRSAVAVLVNEFAAEIDGGEIEAWMVEETVAGYSSTILEDGLDPPTLDHDLLVGPDDSEPDETEDGPILDLDILPEPSFAHPARFKRSTLFLGTDERSPLLVSVPRILVPPSLATDLRPDAKTVVVEFGEFERRGGPVKNRVIDLAELRAAALAVGIVTMIQTTNEHVDWARRTVNPVTGCLHVCKFTFCYAAGIARRLFAQGFIPTLHPARLNAFASTRLPNIIGMTSEQAWRERSVFVVSMGDLFGKWIPRWYRQAVLDEIRLNPGWFCFLLTKDPDELVGLDFPPNCAVGLTITGDEATTEGQSRIYQKYAKALGRVEGAAFTWLSIEPLRGEIYNLTPFFDAGATMVAYGAQSRTVLSPPKPGDPLIIVPAQQPNIRWIESIRDMCVKAGVEYYEKENVTVKHKVISWPAGRPGA